MASVHNKCPFIKTDYTSNVYFVSAELFGISTSYVAIKDADHYVITREEMRTMMARYNKLFLLSIGYVATLLHTANAHFGIINSHCGGISVASSIDTKAHLHLQSLRVRGGGGIIEENPEYTSDNGSSDNGEDEYDDETESEEEEEEEDESSKSSCCQLKSIDLGECMHIEVLGIKSSLIRTLNLSKLGALQLVSLHCSSLVHLNLSGCANLDSKRSIIKCNALESVDIRQAIYITPHFFTGTNKNVSIQM